MNRIISLITGTGSITWKLVIDILSAILGRIAWPIIIERLLTRLIISFLKWLEKISTNDVTKETVEDIRAQLVQARLPKARE